MALIQNLQLIAKQRHSVHAPVEATLSVFGDRNGAKYIQIDTYGSPERMSKGEVSQTIQLNREVAVQLRQFIKQTYPEIT